jgi:hypothetical protein
MGEYDTPAKIAKGMLAIRPDLVQQQMDFWGFHKGRAPDFFPARQQLVAALHPELRVQGHTARPAPTLKRDLPSNIVKLTTPARVLRKGLGQTKIVQQSTSRVVPL